MASILGDFLREVRKRSLLGQKDVAKKLKKSVQFISLIEAGERRPSAKTLPDFADVYNVSLEELKRVYLQSASDKIGIGTTVSSGAALRIGFVHNVWAAPAILLMAYKDQLDGFRFASYGKSDGVSTKPFLNPSDAEPYLNKIMAGPDFVDCDRPENGKLQRWPSGESESLRPYSVADLIGLLTADPPKLDGIIAAYQPVQIFDADVIQCARLMYAYGGCTLLWIKTEPMSTLQSEIPSIKRQDWLDRLASKTLLPVLLPSGTVAQQHLHLLDFKSSGVVVPHEIDLSNWNDVEKELLKRLNKEKEVALIAWEPQISWIVKKLENWNAGISFTSANTEKSTPQTAIVDAELKPFQENKQRIHWFAPQETRNLVEPNVVLPYVSFDLILRKQLTESRAQRANVGCLVGKLDAASKQLTDAKRYPNSLEVCWIASYLNMTAERCSNMLSNMEFCTFYHRNWVEQLRR